MATPIAGSTPGKAATSRKPPPGHAQKRRPAAHDGGSAPLSGSPTLFSPLAGIPGIGPKRAAAFAAAGCGRVLDLLRLLPRRHEDRTALRPLAAARPGRDPQGVFRATLETVKMARPGGGMVIVWALFRDAGGQGRARWFNQPFLSRALVPGKEYFLFGPVAEVKGTVVLDNPEWEPVEDAVPPPVPGALTPVYPARRALSDARISPRLVRRLIARLLAGLDWAASFPDTDPKGPFPRLRQAILDAHWPRDPAAGAQARLTFAFFDQVLFQMGVFERRRALTGEVSVPEERSAPPAAPPFPVPFPLTGDQQAALGAVLHDLAAPGGRPMNRLLQGDVGSGKTMVAFQAMRWCAEGGFQAGGGTPAPDVQPVVPGGTPSDIGAAGPARPQCAFMAPTEILAGQQHQAFLRFFPETAPHTGLLTGSLRASARQDLLAALARGEIRYLFGTHALFQDDVRFADLRFAVIDEQQRFGVDHRRALVRKGQTDARPALPTASHPVADAGPRHPTLPPDSPRPTVGAPGAERPTVEPDNPFTPPGGAQPTGGPGAEGPNTGLPPPTGGPHLLLLSATPIPRTLALTMFGDMDVSVLRDRPPGRRPVETLILPGWQAALPALHDHLDRGGQAFFICPIIEKSGRSDRASLGEARVKLAKALPGVTLEAISGQQDTADNLEAMRRFRGGQTRLLVATSMVEVGIDHPGATLMVIEDAHRFGLSQLHQLRGRIGRGGQGPAGPADLSAASLPHPQCLLVSPQAESERLDILVRTDDGFVIAQADLRLRGPGDLVGMRQSGLSHPAFSHDLPPEMLEKARRRAFELLTREPAPVRDWFRERMAESFGPALATFMDGG
ncbi:MAG: DEAD/DEAH box helicase [Candidatus Riflebacteria bacterium]|nr:DEAD/DEAH box helicase [Candidatus Riflebacteria bacterium]